MGHVSPAARLSRTPAGSSTPFGSPDEPRGYEALYKVRGLADTYVHLLDALDLSDTVVVGNSIGGWIAAEMAVRAPRRVSRYVLVDAVGIAVPDHPVADFFSLSFPQLASLSYHDPERFRIDPAALPPERQAVMAANRAALATYAGASMVDLGLRERLGAVTDPVLVVWGDSDGIVDPDYGRAYAAAIPTAEFALVGDCGHLPQLERPDRLIELITRFTAGD